MRARDLRDERGGFAVIAAILLIALFSMAALAADGGLLHRDRSNDQNAADHAALAASWAFCTGGNPMASALAAAADNGYDDDGVTNDVKVTDRGQGRYEVEVFRVRDAAFGGVVGDQALESRAWAVADCEEGAVAGSGGFAVFAHSEVCPKTVDWSGSTNLVNGAVHSNHDIHVGGSNSSVDGNTTYNDNFHNGGGGNSFDPPPQSSPVLPDPFAEIFAVSKYVPGGEKAALAASQGRYFNAGNAKIDNGWLKARGHLNESTGQLRTGLYFTTDDVDISNSNLKGTVTFVTSAGQLKISGSSQSLQPWDPQGLLAASHDNRACGEYGVAVSGSSSSWRGALYAPRALVEMSGSVNSTFEGALVGDEVRLNGSELDISFQDLGGWVKGTPKVYIIE